MIKISRVFIITTYKKVFTTIAVFIFVGISICFISAKIKQGNNIQTSTDTIFNDTEELFKENKRLRNALGSILPKEQKVLYENPYRLYGNSKASIATTSLKEVVEKGKVLQYRVSYKVPEYLRPIYDPMWVSAYFRGWIDLRYKIEEARHRLYTFSLGGSANFDLVGSLGFNGSPGVDAHRNINFLIYHFDVEGVKQFGNQIALIGRPKRTGVQVIVLNKDDLFPENEGAGDFLIQLSTSEGYEIDYIYEMKVMKYTYLMKNIEEHSVKPIPAFSNGTEMNLDELKKENKGLKEELTKYVPINQEAVITEGECKLWPRKDRVGKTYSLKTVNEKGSELKSEVLYQNNKYTRPIYQPEWKRKASKGWSYVPEKICENLHILFSIPHNSVDQLELMGKLGFDEKYRSIPKNQIAFILYNFSVNKVMKYNNQIVLYGMPSRTGAEIISIDSSLLLKKKNYCVQAATFDFTEVDYDISLIE